MEAVFFFFFSSICTRRRSFGSSLWPSQLGPVPFRRGTHHVHNRSRIFKFNRIKTSAKNL